MHGQKSTTFDDILGEELGHDMFDVAFTLALLIMLVMNLYRASQLSRWNSVLLRSCATARSARDFRRTLSDREDVS